MARNGSGTMAITNEFTPSTTISSSKVNANFTDIGNEITNSVAVDGQSTMTAPLKLANGTVSAPALTFGSDTNIGVYRIGADNIGVSVNGAKVLDIATTGLSITGTLTPSGQIVSSAGTKTAPGYSFTGDLDTGLYLIGANNIGISAGDTKIVDISATGVTITGTFGFSGNFAINTDKFTVEAASGNTAIAGTLGVTGDVSVNTDKFTVDASTGDVESAGNATVGGSLHASGNVVQAVDATPYTSYTSFTATIPSDDTAPAVTEGTEILTKAITPTSSSNTVKVRVDGFCLPFGSGSVATVALFRGSTCIRTFKFGLNTNYTDVGFSHTDSPATTNSTTYSVRVGSPNGASIYINGDNSSRLFGGTAAWTMRLEEIEA